MSKAKALEHLMNPFHWVDLTTRQSQVIKQACRGRRSRLIAADLGIGEVTVRSYLRNALIKINQTPHPDVSPKLSMRDLPGALLKLVDKELRA